MTDERYNGWKNYETWAVGLYLDGNYTGEEIYLEVLSLTREASDDFSAENVASGIWSEQEARTFAVEDALKSWFEDSLPDLGASIVSDLLSAACSEIDWRELAEHKISEIAENDESEDA